MMKPALVLLIVAAVAASGCTGQPVPTNGAVPSTGQLTDDAAEQALEDGTDPAFQDLPEDPELVQEF